MSVSRCAQKELYHHFDGLWVFVDDRISIRDPGFDIAAPIRFRFQAHGAVPPIFDPDGMLNFDTKRGCHHGPKEANG